MLSEGKTAHQQELSIARPQREELGGKGKGERKAGKSNEYLVDNILLLTFALQTTYVRYFYSPHIGHH